MTAREIENQVEEVTRQVKLLANGPVAQSLTAFGVEYRLNYGVSIPQLQQIAENYKGNHELALLLFQQDFRELKIIATLIADPQKVTGEQIDAWAQSFTNVEIVEQVCSNLFWKTEFALSRSIEWCLNDDELLQKAGLIIAAKSASNHNIKDVVFEPYIEIIGNYSDTQIAQNKSTIEFTLRQIAYRTNFFKGRVLDLAQGMADSDDEHKAWIGGQLLFELGGE